MSIGFVCRNLSWLVVAFFALLIAPRLCAAQPFFFSLSSRFELSDSVEVPQADADTLSRLEQAKAFAGDQQWDEAVETLRQVMEKDLGRVIAASDRRYVSVREYCQMRLAVLPAQALALYRARIDAQAKRLFDDVVARHDVRALRDMLDQYFVSSTGDDALLALGDMALERGEHGVARASWEALIPTPPQSVPRDAFDRTIADDGLATERREQLQRWYQPDSAIPPAVYRLRTDEALTDETRRELVACWNDRNLPPNRLAYPDSDVDLASVRARLVLVSILEGSLERAADELVAFTAMHASARGRLAGLEVNYVESLTALLAGAKDWQPSAAGRDWPTFAGAMSRSHCGPAALAPDVVLWSEPISLPKAPVTDSFYPSPRVAETKNELLSYHPIVVGNLVAVNTQHEIRIYDLRTGKPAWGGDAVIFRPAEPIAERVHGTASTLGVARFTLTAHEGFLYARMGDPLTTRPEDSVNYHQPSYLVGLDLVGEGRLTWPPLRLEEKWAYEGSPVTDGKRVFVALRHGTRPQSHVACYDARTGRQLWRQFVASAETPSRGQSGECTHNLLTLVDDVVYVNTNLGAVAALAADTGHPLWIVRYPRAKKGDLNQRATHFYRDLTPCLYDRGRLIVAPADSESILAYDAATGLLLWETNLANDVVHLLGVGGDALWASGEKLWRINVMTGKVSYPWPEGPTPKGFGRGVLAGGKVYWPTVQAIHVFDQRTGQEQAPVMLEARGIHSGNLVAAGEVLVIASSDRLTALGPADYSAAGNTLGQGERAKPRTEQATRAPAPSGRTRPASQSASGR
ncbi:MAG TPA: PQQ-binding-like beta-propeller repeat protein [Pirellulales bacterium]